jgi:hypothetical protein
MVPPKQLLLLVKGFISQRRDRRGRSIENNFLLIFDQKEERSVRVFAAMLLPGIQDDQQIEYSSTHSKWLKQINRCIIDGSLGTFHIDPTLLEVVNTIIKEGEHQASSQRASAYPSKEVALAMNSLQRREELADLLYEFPLPLRESQREIIPLVVVTGNEAPETLIRAGAWRILTLLSKYEHWYTFPKPRQNTLRFIVLIGAGVSCAIILALVILLVKKW